MVRQKLSKLLILLLSQLQRHQPAAHDDIAESFTDLAPTHT